MKFINYNFFSNFILLRKDIDCIKKSPIKKGDLDVNKRDDNQNAIIIKSLSSLL